MGWDGMGWLKNHKMEREKINYVQKNSQHESKESGGGIHVDRGGWLTPESADPVRKRRSKSSYKWNELATW